MKPLKKLSVASLFALVAVGALAVGAETKKEEPAKKPYPAKVCVVSDEPLGSMGKPHVIQHEGREVRFCCASCDKEFKKDPKKYIEKLDKLAKETPAEK